MALTYEHAVTMLTGALRFGVHPSLDSITAICEVLDRPQDAYKVIQVGGTNGKSSVTWMTEALLVHAGVKAASYTSPHLHDYTERIRLGGEDCSRDEFATAVSAAVDAATQAGIAEPTEFELITAAALWLFRDKGVEVAVLEVGMGGRWDATSVARPQVAVVTGVGLDHAKHLGDTREQIAAEKAWIIRDGATAILGPGIRGLEDIFESRAAEEAAQVVRVDAGVMSEGFTLPPDMPRYQASNAAMAREAAASLIGESLEHTAVTAALAQLRLPARFEILSEEPLVVADGSHNPQAAMVLGGAIRERFPAAPRVVLSVLDDKDAAGIVDVLIPVARSIIVTRSDSPRALSPSELAKIVAGQTGLTPPTCDSLAEALESLGDDMDDGVVVTGSLTIAAEAREHFVGT